MKLEYPNCPTCGGPAIGTVEQVPGLAIFTDVDANGCTEYGGETEIWWNDQRTITDADGRATLVCDGNHQWQSRIEGGEMKPLVVPEAAMFDEKGGAK